MRASVLRAVVGHRSCPPPLRYLFFVATFAAFSMVMSLFELREQVIVQVRWGRRVCSVCLALCASRGRDATGAQVAMTLCRVSIVTMMVITVFVAMGNESDGLKPGQTGTCGACVCTVSRLLLSLSLLLRCCLRACACQCAPRRVWRRKSCLLGARADQATLGHIPVRSTPPHLGLTPSSSSAGSSSSSLSSFSRSSCTLVRAPARWSSVIARGT